MDARAGGTVPTNVLVEVKTAGYKMSGKNWKSGTWKRYGFTQLFLDRIKKAQPGWWCQAQAMMAAASVPAVLFVVLAKDTIKAFEEDELTRSLAWYVELVWRDEAFIENELRPTWDHQYGLVQRGIKDTPAMFYNGEGYVTLKKADPDGNKGRNKELTGTFNPCHYCDLFDACKKEIKA